MNISLKEYYRILARYLANQKLQFTGLCILVLTSIGLQIVNPQIMRYFIDAATTGKAMATLSLAAIGYLCAALIQQAVSVCASYVGELVAWTATNALREDLALHCLRLDMKFHNDRSPGELIERIEGDVTEFSNFFSQLVIRIIGNIILVVGILIALYIVDWRLGIVFTLFASVTLFALNSVREISVPYTKAQRDAETELFGFLEERLAGTEDIRSSGAVDFVIKRLYQLQTTILRRWWKSSFMTFWVWTTAGATLMLGYALAFGGSYFLYRGGIITLGTAYLIINYTNSLARPIRELTRQVESLQNIGASIYRIGDLLKYTSVIKDGKGAAIPGDKALSLEFTNVTFEYKEEKPVLNRLNFRIEPGKVLGLLGRTGTGKTTLARLIFRLYDPQSGEIRVGGQSVQNVKLSDLRHRIAYVTQDVQLFQASVRDNITFFDRSIDDDRIMKVLDALGLSEWFKGLPEGLDTRLATGGRSLSAGEAQLLALTRVFLRNPGVVILDEASSRLDPATEQLVERAIDTLLHGRTAIIIAHRLATVHRSDDILILDEGSVVEYGNREKLLSNPDSKFYSLHQTGLEELLA